MLIAEWLLELAVKIAPRSVDGVVMVRHIMNYLTESRDPRQK